MNFIKNNLLVQVVLAILLGILLGEYLPESIVRIFTTFNTLFSEYLNFAIPLIILGLIIPAIGSLGSQAGKLVGITALVAYISTLIAGFSSYGISTAVFPGLLKNQNLEQMAESAAKLSPYFTISVPPLMDVMTALFLAFIIGVGVAQIKNSTLLNAALDFEIIMSNLIQKTLIPLLPLFIFGIFMNIAYTGEVYTILNVFIKIIGVIFVMHIAILVFQFVIAGAVSKRNPFTMLKTMLPAYFTALGTQSSAATIPVTLEQVRKIGISEDIAKLVIPLCATIHLSGSTLKIVACCIALMLIQGMPIEIGAFSGFICMLGIAMVAAPGVPGGAIMAAIGIIGSMLGFNEANQALMISLYIAMDSFGTACNVTGDGAIAVLMDHWFGKKKASNT